ncbi:MAG: superoxide dismutase family protein [Epulopiscium sp.]|nr:superoxide dismutase family protein [Candidatus Epulonipiscium sp.]
MFEYTIQPSMAIAYIHGGPLAPQIQGIVIFKSIFNGTEVYVSIQGLPSYQSEQPGKPPIGPHGFHIHEFGSCSIGNPENSFTEAGGHWNPDNQPHGNHAGDFPVLFSNNGIARMSFFTNRFTVEEIIGKSLIIHESPDDYRSQPAGNSGKRLACGIIQKLFHPIIFS